MQGWSPRSGARMAAIRPTGRPEDISVAEIVLAVDGPVALTACVDGGDCAIEATCLLRGSWDRINNAVRDALEEVTLADMLAPMRDFSRFEAQELHP